MAVIAATSPTPQLRRCLDLTSLLPIILCSPFGSAVGRAANISDNGQMALEGLTSTGLRARVFDFAKAF
jgi:hypothetical protein